MIGTYRASNKTMRTFYKSPKCTVGIYRGISVLLCLSETKILRHLAILLLSCNQLNFQLKYQSIAKIHLRKYCICSQILTKKNIMRTFLCFKCFSSISQQFSIFLKLIFVAEIIHMNRDRILCIYAIVCPVLKV